MELIKIYFKRLFSNIFAVWYLSPNTLICPTIPLIFPLKLLSPLFPPFPLISLFSIIFKFVRSFYNFPTSFSFQFPGFYWYFKLKKLMYSLDAEIHFWAHTYTNECKYCAIACGSCLFYFTLWVPGIKLNQFGLLVFLLFSQLARHQENI